MIPPCAAPLPRPQLSLLPEEDFSHTQHELWLAEAYYRTGGAGGAAKAPSDSVQARIGVYRALLCFTAALPTLTLTSCSAQGATPRRYGSIASWPTAAASTRRWCPRACCAATCYAAWPTSRWGPSRAQPPPSIAMHPL